MRDILSELINPEEHQQFRDFIFILSSGKNRYLLRNDILLEFMELCKKSDMRGDTSQKDSSVSKFLDQVHEMFIIEDSIFILHRYSTARYQFYRMGRNSEHMEEISTAEYLNYKDLYVLGREEFRLSRPALRIDFGPFYDYSPIMRDSKNIGNGIRFLNKHLSSSLFQKSEKWTQNLFEFITLHKINNKPLLINGHLIQSEEEMLNALEKALKWLKKMAPDTPFADLSSQLKLSGFEDGWGKDAARVCDTMQLLYELFTEPDSDLLERFITRIPMISRIAIISPHGWFGQENVLGRPDTGGQVIYILDQVRALEKYLKERFALAGIGIQPKIIVLTRLIPEAENTSCDQRIEKIFGTKNGWILRVPFLDKNLKPVRHWISRFHIWPYLDRFAYDSRKELVSEFEGRPDLIIGNYSDGNLVATMLSDHLDVIQCTIAHALEKTKYLFSDLYWKQMENDYNFSTQFTADMIAMNKSDFIIASTYQEIAGTETNIGQYESHQFFTLPGLYQAVCGVNLFSPKFNIVPPGVDETVYFPCYEQKKRTASHTEHWKRELFTEKNDNTYGWLESEEKIPVFTMARLDKIKNITGLIEAFGRHEKLREHCNLIFSAGTIHIDRSHDREEQEQIRQAHALIDELNLHGSVRWLPNLNRADTGEVYRIIADQRGIFVQPALFEAFGLTILEAMISGLPTFGPQFGGPSEIIVDKQSGILMNTSRPELIADTIWEFIEQCKTDPELWNRISKNGIKRVREKFTWRLYSEKLISLSKLYGFWRYAAAEKGMIKMDRYCDLIYHLLLKNRPDF